MNFKIALVQTITQVIILSLGYYLLEVFVRKNNYTISEYILNYWFYGVAAFIGLLITKYVWNKSELKK